MNEKTCRCPNRPYFGSMARDSLMERNALAQWQQEHGHHAYAKTRDRIAGAIQEAESAIRGEEGRKSGEAVLDMVHDIMGAKRFSGDSPTKEYVLHFAELMESRLAGNRHKGDREGWLQQSVLTHIKHATKHLLELEAALLHSRVERHDLERLTADCANRLMMARDRFNS